jgi:hypothetical protein
VDGFRAEELGITVATLAGVPNVKPVVSFNPGLAKVTARATGCSAEGNALVPGPQRFTWTFALQFDDTSDFTQESQSVGLTATLTSTAGDTVSAPAILVLTKQPNPYEIDGPTSWLSVDLQVFQLLQNNALPGTPGIVMGTDPNAFITQLLSDSGGYNDTHLPRAPNHPFDTDLVAHQDTSAVELAQLVNGTPVYNFAVARVRYRVLWKPAPNVRVFFRLFQAATTAAGMSRPELQAAAGLVPGRVKGFEERGAKPHATTRDMPARVLRAPDLEWFGDEGDEHKAG